MKVLPSVLLVMAEAMGVTLPRKSYKDMRPEYLKALSKSESYFNVITEDAINFYKPYRDLWALQVRWFLSLLFCWLVAYQNSRQKLHK